MYMVDYTLARRYWTISNCVKIQARKIIGKDMCPESRMTEEPTWNYSLVEVF